MKGKVAGWMVFLLCVVLLSLAATPYSRAVDHALMAARFAIIVVLSVLVVGTGVITARRSRKFSRAVPPLVVRRSVALL
jgi:predicted transporter